MTSEPPDSGDPDDGAILSEDELDISDEENVAELDDGRYVVSASGAPNVPSTESNDESPPTAATTPASEPDLTRDDVEEWLYDYLADADAEYGFHITAKFDDGVDQQRVVSNDVVTSFEMLVVWYANQIGDGTPVEDVLGILLSESNVSVRYPVQTLVGLLETHDLGHEDTIGDLLEAIADERGVNLP